MGKKNILSWDSNFELMIWGIHTDFPAFQVCDSINQLLRLELSRVPDLLFDPLSDSPRFMRYSAKLNDRNISYLLLKNKFQQEYFVPEFKSFDYFFMVEDLDGALNEQEISKKLKQTAGVNLVFKIDLSKVKPATKSLFAHVNFSE